MNGSDSEARGYEDFYRAFDSALMKTIREEAYGRDIGQHSWVSAEELLEDIPRLGLSRESRLLDLGCGPGGPLTFIASQVGCRGTGFDVSAAAIAAGRARSESLGLANLLGLHEADLNRPLPVEDASFDAAISLDVVLHLRDRVSYFRDISRVLVPGARLLFTDAGVITGPVSEEEIRSRSVHGYTQFCPPGYNERMLSIAGFRLLDSIDRTAGLMKNASGRLTARLAHRSELERLEGSEAVERQERYLETVCALALRGAVSRISYLAENRARPL